MVDVNPAALRKRHLAAERWERCRAAWFELRGDAIMAKKCLYLAKDSLKIARNAQTHMKKL